MGVLFGTHLGEERCIKILVGQSEGKRPPERPRHRRQCNIKMDLREMDYETEKWIQIDQHRTQCRTKK
jgi:hypothetical protein